MFKRRLGTDAVADLLYGDVFCPLADNMSESLQGLIDPVERASPHAYTQLKLEWFSLVAFLITFSFQREFAHLGQEKNNFIMDHFHQRLFGNVPDSSEDDIFPERMKARYREYYPIMKEDCRCLGIEDTIVFRGMTEAFVSRIAPDKLHSKESLLFSLFLADLYSLILKSYEKIKNYKIT